MPKKSAEPCLICGSSSHLSMACPEVKGSDPAWDRLYQQYGEEKRHRMGWRGRIGAWLKGYR